MKVTFYASAFTTPKTFAICPQYGDYTDRNWYYQHSNYRSIVREACKGLSRHQSKAVVYQLKTELDAQYEREVLPVLEGRKAPVVDSCEEELMELLDVIEHQSVTIGMQVKFVDDAKARIAELEAKLQRKEEVIVKLQEENKQCRISIRQLVSANLVTKHAASIAGKIAKVATTEININIG